MSLHLNGVGVDVGAPPLRAVADVDLTVADGEVLAVLGPSGCGKSTLLRAIAGLEPLADGRVSWDGADLAGVPTHRRGFALMFQEGQLFEHLTVARNVAYPLRLQGLDRRTASTEVGELLELVGLPGYAGRLPRTLSGGERQRVALARALAARPRLLLLDEPLSALDAELRTRLAADLRAILTAAGTTALLVTHDQSEAYAVADRLAVMRDARVVQQGPAAEVWARPADAETARFLGYTRILEGEAARRIGGADRIALRPSALVVADDGELHGTVLTAAAGPDATRLVVDVAGIGELDALADGPPPAPGAAVRLAPTRRGTAPL